MLLINKMQSAYKNEERFKNRIAKNYIQYFRKTANMVNNMQYNYWLKKNNKY